MVKTTWNQKAHSFGKFVFILRTAFSPRCYFHFHASTPAAKQPKTAAAAAPPARKQHPTVAKICASIRIRLVPNFTSLPPRMTRVNVAEGPSGWRLPARRAKRGGRGVTAGVERRVMWSRMTDC